MSKLLEGVKLSSAVEHAAFVVTVAEAYDAAPQNDPKAEPYWNALIQHTEKVLFKRLKGSGIKVSFHEDDPYEDDGQPGSAMKFMLYDMVMNHRLMIYSGFSDNHPTFSADENIIFRAVHDFYTHASIRKDFSNQLKAAAREMKLSSWPTIENAGPLLARVKLNSHQFNARGEFNATSDHMRMAPANAAPAIFTEVTGQVCYQTIVGQFPVQKVAILPGFDYRNIGQCRAGSPQQARKEQVMQMLKRGDAEIRLSIQARRSISREELLRPAHK